jgi:hypothetical protein
METKSVLIAAIFPLIAAAQVINTGAVLNSIFFLGGGVFYLFIHSFVCFFVLFIYLLFYVVVSFLNKIYMKNHIL